VGSIVTADLRSGVGGGEEDVLLQAALRRNGGENPLKVMSPALTTVDGGLGDAGIVDVRERRTP